MSRVNPIVTMLCPVCVDGKILGKNCANCKASGYIHKELVIR